MLHIKYNREGCYHNSLNYSQAASSAAEMEEPQMATVSTLGSPEAKLPEND